MKEKKYDTSSVQPASNSTEATTSKKSLAESFDELAKGPPWKWSIEGEEEEVTRYENDLIGFKPATEEELEIAKYLTALFAFRREDAREYVKLKESQARYKKLKEEFEETDGFQQSVYSGFEALESLRETGKISDYGQQFGGTIGSLRRRNPAL
jgi:hypothetical protein